MQDPTAALDEAEAALLTAARAMNRVTGILVRARAEFRYSPADVGKIEAHHCAMLRIRSAIIDTNDKLTTLGEPLAAYAVQLLAKEGQDEQPL